MTMIPFNKPFIIGKELEYIQQAITLGKLSGNGVFTQKCQSFFETRFGFRKTLLTTSCTDALEMAAMLCEVGAGDEVIIPSYTFVSTALAFVRQGATIVFADSEHYHPNMDVSKIESLITKRTKVIVPVHYAGCACDMDAIMDLAKKYNLWVVEDAAQAVDSYYRGKDGIQRPLGGIGHLGCFSFHETKNIISGEGGLLAINDERFIHRAEILWEKGTNRAEFFRGEINKYGWVDVGSSFLPSELTAAFLYAQLEYLDDIQAKRKQLWEAYYTRLQGSASRPNDASIARHSALPFALPTIPPYATNNAHCFYLVCRSLEERTALINHLKARHILPVFHYLPLHSSSFYTTQHDDRPLPHCDGFANQLVRLPLYYNLSLEEVEVITEAIHAFFSQKKV